MSSYSKRSGPRSAGGTCITCDVVPSGAASMLHIAVEGVSRCRVVLALLQERERVEAHLKSAYEAKEEVSGHCTPSLLIFSQLPWVKAHCCCRWRLVHLYLEMDVDSFCFWRWQRTPLGRLSLEFEVDALAVVVVYCIVLQLRDTSKKLNAEITRCHVEIQHLESKVWQPFESLRHLSMSLAHVYPHS